MYDSCQGRLSNQSRRDPPVGQNDEAPQHEVTAQQHQPQVHDGGIVPLPIAWTISGMAAKMISTAIACLSSCGSAALIPVAITTA